MIEYMQFFVDDPDSMLKALEWEVAWERRGSTPRFEYYSADSGLPYAYGKGAGRREYLSKPWHPLVLQAKSAVEDIIKTKMDVCFMNYYKDGKDHLGWHADDSPEMDDERPICIVSLGAEREIWFRKNPTEHHFAKGTLNGHPVTDVEITVHNPEINKVRLGHGSLLIMPPGMQDTHQHRIPKAGHECGARISLTFRGFVNDVAR